MDHAAAGAPGCTQRDICGEKVMHEKWFISDTHFFHDNIIRFCSRPFASAAEMNEKMIDNWNGLVKDGDLVYHLGDVACGYSSFSDKEFSTLLSRLKGRKRLIVGNHDPLKNDSIHRFFEKIELWKGFHEHNFTASHMPLKQGHFRDGEFNVHGHVHNNSLQDAHYLNLSVEVRDYAPVHLDTICAEIKKLSRKP
jgi:calcineurin-like phosphoesterase family protein